MLNILKSSQPEEKQYKNRALITKSLNREKRSKRTYAGQRKERPQDGLSLCIKSGRQFPEKFHQEVNNSEKINEISLQVTQCEFKSNLLTSH